jgi:cyclophilin family peptidyl-prolyl cis-trans isomerase
MAKAATQSDTPKKTPAAKKPAAAKVAAAKAPAAEKAPVAAKPAGDRLLMETSQGPVVIKLRPDLAPGHVERIKTLASQGFYDGIKFHRVIAGFMAQTGCPRGTGTGGSSLPDLKAEFNAHSHQRGVCSMARAQSPNSANSQFFICFDDASFLDKQYTAWGEVIEGMDNIDKLAKGEPPRSPDHIVSMKVG